MAKKISLLTAIVKVSELCNIDCDYCYYYHMGDESWKDHPPYMDDSVFDLLCSRLVELLNETEVQHLHIAFHGGEPMMAGADRLERFVANARRHLFERVQQLSFSIQTNGTIFSEQWFRFFEQSGISIGVSIDGPAAYHDFHRKTKQGKPTHSFVETFLMRCGASASEGKMLPPGTITVLNADRDLASIILYLQRTFKLKSMAFLLPDDAVNDATFSSSTAERYGQLLVQLYEAMTLDPKIRSGEVSKFLWRAKGEKLAGEIETGEELQDTIPYVGVTIHSSGVLKVNEELIATGGWRKDFPAIDLMVEPISAFLNHHRTKALIAALNGIPSKCTDCCWAKACRGGSLHERRNPGNGFNERSVFCASYKKLYQHMYEDLVSSGFPEELLISRLS